MCGGSRFVQAIVFLKRGNGGLRILSCDAIRRSAIVARFVQRRLDALYIGFRISEEDKERFVALAMEKGLSISALMRILVREYLKGEMYYGL